MQGEQITKLSIAGFKSIANEITLDIKPLTLLAGANSSGKSSFMQPLLLLKQTLEAPYDPGPLLLNGKNVKFTSFEQMVSSQKNAQRRFSVSLNSGEALLSLVFSKKNEKPIAVSNLFSRQNNIWFDSDMDAEQTLKTLQIFDRKEKRETFATWNIERKHFFVSVHGYNENGVGRRFYRGCDYDFFSGLIERVIHVPGLRGNPERAYQAASVGRTFSGTFEHYTANIVANWEKREVGKLKQLCDALSRMGLTSKISAKPLNDAQIEVMVGRLPLNGRTKPDMVSIADVGFGVSQTLPVLVALLAAEPGQLVYLEQPEIHLHPRAQRALAEILVEAANRGVIVVAETHSSMLLLAVQTLIATQKISPDNVALHWFQRNKDGITEVSTAELDNAGRFGEWPIDFGDVELEAEGDYLKAVALTRKGR